MKIIKAQEKTESRPQEDAKVPPLPALKTLDTIVIPAIIQENPNPLDQAQLELLHFENDLRDKLQADLDKINREESAKLSELSKRGCCYLQHFGVIVFPT